MLSILNGRGAESPHLAPSHHVWGCVQLCIVPSTSSLGSLCLSTAVEKPKLLCPTLSARGGEGWKLNLYNCHPPLSQQGVITGAVVTPESSKAAGVFTSRSCGALRKAPPELHPFHSREEGSREGGRNLPGNASRPCHALPEAEQTADEGRGFPQRAESQWSCAHPPHGAAHGGGLLPGALWCRGSLSAGAFSFHLIINAKQCQCLHITCVRWLTGAKLEQIPWKDRTCSLVPR